MHTEATSLSTRPRWWRWSCYTIVVLWLGLLWWLEYATLLTFFLDVAQTVEFAVKRWL
jgi:hypothetical protein